jgi:hypothetical protein
MQNSRKLLDLSKIILHSFIAENNFLNKLGLMLVGWWVVKINLNNNSKQIQLMMVTSVVPKFGSQKFCGFCGKML